MNMEQNNCLGIYISTAKATAVLLSPNAAHPAVLGSCSVVKESQEAREGEQPHGTSMVKQLATRLASSGFRYGEVCLSLDCALYTQHNLRSEFTEHKQIANTIMFDAEEALARDATEMALTFNVVGSDDNGSRVSVFTADRAVLNTMLTELQGENLDPTAIEPDILCLARFLEYFSRTRNVNSLYVVLGGSETAGGGTGRKCYMIHPQGQHHGPLVRSFIMGGSQNATAVLQREIPLTLAAMNLSEPVTEVFIDGPPDAVDTAKIAETTGIGIQAIDLAAMAGTAANGTAPTELAMACGAALAQVKRIRPNDFRRSFAPYQGRRLVLQKTLRAISIMVTVSMLVLGAYAQLKVFRKQNYVSQLEKNLAEDYRTVMYGADPPRSMPIATRLQSEYTKLNKIRGDGIGDESSIPAKLTYMLEAINGTPANIDLNVISIDLTGSRMSLRGDTNRRASTLTLFSAFMSHPKLQKIGEQWSEKSNRDVFTVNLELRKGKGAQ
jgi:hypothetical protein